jgi:Ubiquitin-2 like Rad60 SUMO-like
MTLRPASPPTTKKSFFKKPTWATSAPPSQSGDFFRHSDTVYHNILREKERRREKHAQKKQASVEVDAVQEGQGNKRRRISIEEEDQEEDGPSDSDTASTGSRRVNTAEAENNTEKAERPENRSNSPARVGPCDAGRASPPNAKSSLNATAPVCSNVIELESDDEKPEPQPNAPAKVQTRVSDEEISEEEDEYVLELKQKARAKARLRELGTDPLHNQGSARRTLDVQQRTPLSPFNENSSTFTHQHPVSIPPPDQEDTIVSILINTKIPNAKQLIVNRKVSQPMQQVRKVWCSRQNFDDEMTAKVIFTWRGRRLYDTTTSTHLLNVLKKERARQMGGLANEDDEDPSNGRIEVEAMTKDMYEQRQRRDDTETDTTRTTDPSTQDDPSRDKSATPPEPVYKIVMNAQGLEALTLKVRPSTPIAKVMAGFKKVRNVDAEKTCWLVFDGERLDPDAAVGDTEIEDGDAVEVHVR